MCCVCVGLHIILSNFRNAEIGGADMVIQDWSPWIMSRIVWAAQWEQIEVVFSHPRRELGSLLICAAIGQLGQLRFVGTSP